MDRGELDEIRRLLALTGHTSLFAYLGLDLDSDTGAVDEALKSKRAWAQSQQSNPKHRTEATWLIKHLALCRRVLVDQRDDYVRSIQERDQRRKIQILRLFILGTLADGVLSKRGEAAIHDHAAKLSLPDAVAEEQIEALLDEQGASRVEVTGEVPAPFVDHYAVLGVHPEVDQSNLEAAWQARYAWARQLRDARRASELYQQLDEAWRILRDPDTRTAYDQARQAHLGDAPRRAPEASPTLKPLEPPPRTPPPPTRLGVTPSAPPRLLIDGPPRLRVRTQGQPIERTVEIRNGGPGPMPGKVHSDQPWLTVTPEQLTPQADHQSLLLRIDPSLMSRKDTLGLVTIETEHGERRSVTVEVELPRRRWLWSLAAAVVLILAGVALWARPHQAPPPAPPPPPGHLIVQVDPPVGEIYVDDHLVSANGQVELSEELPQGGVLRLRVEADGFAPWTRSIQVSPGAVESVVAHLELTAPMDFQPGPKDTEVALDQGRAQRSISQRMDRLQACLNPTTTDVKQVNLTAYIGIHGRVIGTVFTPPSQADSCLRRELRAIRFPLVPGDYGTAHAVVQRPR